MSKGKGKRGDRRCGTCRHAVGEVGGLLSCCRYPPTVPVPGERLLGTQMTDYPKVSGDDEACGEWKKARKG